MSGSLEKRVFGRQRFSASFGWVCGGEDPSLSQAGLVPVPLPIHGTYDLSQITCLSRV